MVDSYTRKDERSFCEKYGHKYEEIASEKRSRRETYTQHPTLVPDDDLEGMHYDCDESYDVTRYVDYELVTYRCRHCGKEVTHEE